MRTTTIHQRHGALALACGLAAALVAACGGVARANPADQAGGYQGSASHSGYIADAGLTAPLTQAWDVTLDGTTSYPLIVDGVVYVTTGAKTLYALNQATGATLWSRGTGGQWSYAHLAYDDGQVFLLNSGGTLTALDPKTGSVNWSRSTPGETTPAAANGIVYLTTNSGYVRAYRERDGQELWTVQGNGTSDAAPAVDADGVYVSFACQQTYAYDRLTGEQRWHHPSDCSGGGGDVVAVAGGRLYARDYDANLIYSTATGDVLGSFNAGPIPAIGAGRMYALNASKLTAVSNSGLGTNAWQFTGDGSLVTAPLVAGGLVFAGSSTGRLYALDGATGATSWSTDVGGAISAGNRFTAMAAANGTLVVPAGDRLLAYRADGAISAEPASVALPTIDGLSRRGEILGADVGIWSRLPHSYGYQWERCDGAGCTDIPTATGPSFSPQASEVGATLRVRVTATNAAGTSAAVVSDASAPVAALAPASQGPPTITGTLRQGSTLTAGHGTWSGNPAAYAYRWLRCPLPNDFGDCGYVAGATGSTYVLTAADVERRMRVRVVANNGSDSDPADSAYTGSILGPVPTNATPPDFSGYLVEGGFLSADPGTWNGAPWGYRYQWYSCDADGTSCPDIPGATNQVYTLRASEVGRYIGVEVVAFNSYGDSAPADSDAFGPVAMGPPVNLSPPDVAGTARAGETLTTSPGSWSGNPTSYAYQWYRCDAGVTRCEPAAGATSATYAIGPGDVGQRIGVGVVAFNEGGSSDEEGSYLTDVVAPAAAAAPPAAPPATVVLPRRAAFTWSATRVRTDGSIALTQRVTAAGAFTALARTPSAVYARGSAKAKRAGTVTLVLKPTKAGKRVLRRKRSLRTRVKVTFTPTGGVAAASQIRTVTVRVRALRRAQVRVARR